jgi:membrane-associated phospholipid phosphatase
MHQLLSVSIWQLLEEWDKALFLRINRGMVNPLFDGILPYFRDSVFWVPLYTFLLFFMLLNYGKRGLWWSLFFILTVAIADMTGARFFKPFFHRLRPCQDPLFFSQVRLVLKGCSGSFSFVSNHAANHFGLATFAVLTFRHQLGRWVYLAYLWAFAVAFAQVYVGVHYPLDALGGAGLGTMAGVLTAWLFHKRWGRLRLDNIN